MKIANKNLKNPNYNENHEIYVGTLAGSFKRISVTPENPYAQINLANPEVVEKEAKITALAFANDAKTKILLGRISSQVECLNIETNSFEENYTFSVHPIVGIGTYERKLITGLESGEVFIQNRGTAGEDVKRIVAGDNMSKMRQSKFDKKLIATGGKDRQNNLKIIDLTTKKKIFLSKNLPNDHLQLEVPIWDCDFEFLNSNLIASCSRYGYVRLYDTRVQRRPVEKYANEDQMSFSSLTGHGYKVYVGSTMGALKAFDIRFFKNFVHTYKGATGAITDLCVDDESGKYLAASSLDRFVRVHHADTCVMMYQCYIKTKGTAILLKDATTVKNEIPLENHPIDENAEIKNEKEESDDEYNEMFQNMEKVSEIEEIKRSQSAEEEECNEDESGGSSSMKMSLKKKRKAEEEKKNNKKKMKN